MINTSNEGRQFSTIAVIFLNNFLFAPWVLYSCVLIPVEIWAISKGYEPGTLDRFKNTSFIVTAFCVIIFALTGNKRKRSDVEPTARTKEKEQKDAIAVRRFAWRVYPALILILIVMAAIYILARTPAAYTIWIGVGVICLVVDRALRKLRIETE